MLKEIYRNKFYYLILFLGQVLGLMVFFKLPQYRQETIAGLCTFYFLWGISHHILEKDLHIKIIMEYLLVSMIACFILLSLLWRA